MLTLIDSGLLGELDASREIAALVGLIYLLTAGAVGFGIVAPKSGAHVLNVEDAEELREMRPMLVWSCLGTFALALLLILAALAGPAMPIAPVPALAIIAVLFAFAWYASHRQRAHTDELMRAVSSDATSLAFYLVVLLGGGWSLLTHLGLVEATLAPLDWLSLFAGLLLVASFAITVKRGMVREL